MLLDLLADRHGIVGAADARVGSVSAVPASVDLSPFLFLGVAIENRLVLTIVMD